jgi:hypothetical protein
MEARQNDRGVSGTERQERRSSTASPDGSPITTRKTGAGLEEDWASLGTDDPAFWLKEPDQD